MKRFLAMALILLRTSSHVRDPLPKCQSKKAEEQWLLSCFDLLYIYACLFIVHLFVSFTANCRTVLECRLSGVNLLDEVVIMVRLAWKGHAWSTNMRGGRSFSNGPCLLLRLPIAQTPNCSIFGACSQILYINSEEWSLQLFITSFVSLKLKG